MTMELKIDDAIAAKLRTAAASEQISFNEAVCLALAAGADIRFGAGLPKLGIEPTTQSKPYRMPTHSFGDPMTNLKSIMAELQEEEDLERYKRGGG